MKLENLKGIGPKSLEHLNTLGIYEVEDLVRNYPYRFDILRNMDIRDEKNYDNICVCAIVE